jgi:hypothetical protein
MVGQRYAVCGRRDVDGVTEHNGWFIVSIIASGQAEEIRDVTGNGGQGESNTR